LTNWKQKRW